MLNKILEYFGYKLVTTKFLEEKHDELVEESQKAYELQCLLWKAEEGFYANWHVISEKTRYDLPFQGSRQFSFN